MSDGCDDIRKALKEIDLRVPESGKRATAVP